MDGFVPIVNHHAILIGINDYPNQPLAACVRDVSDIKIHLESTLGSSVQVHILAAASDKADAANPYPTYDNVVSTFRQVTSLAKSGDPVYIHFSGHGSQKPPSGEFSSRPTGDLALVLHGGRNGRESFLWGFELASLLKSMTDKGLIVTLVLDCCFSASVYRDDDDDPDVRFLRYDPDIHANSPATSEQNAGDGDRTLSMVRDADMLPNWLINPDLYAIITACGPYEKAMEPRFSDGLKRGALSYLILAAVKRVGLSSKHKGLYDQVRAAFQDHKLPQNPVFYGNPNQRFFGKGDLEPAPLSIAIIAKRNGARLLQAGSAHGISDGDKFALFPSNSPEPLQGPHVTARVIRTRALTSDLELVDQQLDKIKTGWMAIPLTRLSLQGFPVRLGPCLPTRSKWLTTLHERSLKTCGIDESVVVFDMTVDAEQRYKVLDESGYEIINLPPLPLDQTPISRMGDLLQHLALWRLASGLCNRSMTDGFRQSFSAYIYSNGSSFGPDCPIELQHGCKLQLVLENCSDKPLYFFIYDLGPRWQVQNMKRGTYIVTWPLKDGEPAKHIARKTVCMEIPNQMIGEGHSLCMDVIKVFVTTEPTSFDLLELPALDAQVEVPKAVAVDRANRDHDESEDWAALNFPIRVFLA
ncbi:hypothetical protein BDW59DRAFT_162450 [Aspergillus cavernicola]|uniref:Peptidase C14 caspase domain-containing protein n=1 Tax=Aspergillus cavernicola TaxID=176166 RepID=A0ABR4I9B3_9EURO